MNCSYRSDPELAPAELKYACVLDSYHEFGL